MDRDKLIGELAIKHQILLDKTDPIFALVALNELVLSEMVDKANELSSNMEVNLSPVLERLEATLGFIVVKSELSNEQLVRATNLLRSEACVIINSAKEATYTAGKEQINEVARVIKDKSDNAAGEIEKQKITAIADLNKFVAELKKDIGIEVQKVATVKLEQPLQQAKSVLNESIGLLIDQKEKLEAAAEKAKISWMVRAGWFFGALFLGSMLTVSTAKVFGLFDGAVSKAQFESMQKTQDSIYYQVDKLVKAKEEKRK